MGDQPLYQMKIDFIAQDGTNMDSETSNIWNKGNR